MTTESFCPAPPARTTSSIAIRRILMAGCIGLLVVWGITGLPHAEHAMPQNPGKPQFSLELTVSGFTLSMQWKDRP